MSEDKQLVKNQEYDRQRCRDYKSKKSEGLKQYYKKYYQKNVKFPEWVKRKREKTRKQLKRMRGKVLKDIIERTNQMKKKREEQKKFIQELKQKYQDENNGILFKLSGKLGKIQAGTHRERIEKQQKWKNYLIKSIINRTFNRIAKDEVDENLWNERTKDEVKEMDRNRMEILIGIQIEKIFTSKQRKSSDSGESIKSSTT